MNIFIICTVRDASKEYKQKLENYVQTLEEQGHTVHLPHRDTNQKAASIAICAQNRQAIIDADEVHIFYSPTSQGTHFDMGMCFALKKNIVIVESVPLTKGKSYQNLLAEWVIGSKFLEG